MNGKEGPKSVKYPVKGVLPGHAPLFAPPISRCLKELVDVHRFTAHFRNRPWGSGRIAASPYAPSLGADFMRWQPIASPHQGTPSRTLQAIETTIFERQPSCIHCQLAWSALCTLPPVLCTSSVLCYTLLVAVLTKTRFHLCMAIEATPHRLNPSFHAARFSRYAGDPRSEKNTH